MLQLHIISKTKNSYIYIYTSSRLEKRFKEEREDLKMAKAFRELIGVQPSTVSTDDSVLVIIDAQNEYVFSTSSS